MFFTHSTSVLVISLLFGSSIFVHCVEQGHSSRVVEPPAYTTRGLQPGSIVAVYPEDLYKDLSHVSRAERPKKVSRCPFIITPTINFVLGRNCQCGRVLFWVRIPTTVGRFSLSRRSPRHTPSHTTRSPMRIIISH